eukprot:Colp12_sorted_trinity150504_noHs@35462
MGASTSTEKLSNEESLDASLDIGEPLDISLDPDYAWSVFSPEQVFENPATVVAEENAHKGKTLRFVCISDTHGKHRDLHLPKADVLIHGGDFTNTGEKSQVEDLHKWLCEQEITHKIVIAGNHDVTFELKYYKETGQKKFHKHVKTPFDAPAIKKILQDSSQVIYLEDSAYELPFGIKVWGSPWQPEFLDWGFNLKRGDECRKAWKKIPTDVAVLVTHGPPLGRLDEAEHGRRTGCVDLMQEIQKRVKPRAHIFGHIHEGYGVSSDGYTSYVNASSCNFQYRCINRPIVFDLAVDDQGKPLAPVFVKSRVSQWGKDQVAAWVEAYRSKPKSQSADPAVEGSGTAVATVEGTEPKVDSVEGNKIYWEDYVCDRIAQMTGEELLSLTDENLKEHMPDATMFTSVRSLIDFLREIRKLEAAHY